MSGDGVGSVQNVGYPDFIQIQNSVRMPVARGEICFNAAVSEDSVPVLTECTGARCEEKTELRLSGNDDFYIDQSQGQGQIFLISNNGDTNINQVCSAPCSLTLTAHLENTQPAQLTLQVESSHYC